MTLNRNRLYTLLFTACAAGYIWLYFSMTHASSNPQTNEVCLMKRITHIPCPSCGSTRAVISLTKKDFAGAFRYNPLGYLLVIIMVLSPLWIMVDMITNKSSLFNLYKKTESYLKKPKYAIPLILLVLINWIWNIIKGV